MFIINIGEIITGDINNPLIVGPIAIEIQDGKIVRLSNDIAKKSKCVIDVNGMTVCPGFIDSHFHPVIGDYTPKQNAINFYKNYLEGGVTSMISAGESHLPGRKFDKEYPKALALLSYKSFTGYRPAGVKVYAGALILSKGLNEEDFNILRKEGVWLIAEAMALGNVKKVSDIKHYACLARKYGMKFRLHTGPLFDNKMPIVSMSEVIDIKPDVVCHLNGGPTSLSYEEVINIINHTDSAIEVVWCGNLKSLVDVVNEMRDKTLLERLIIGSDTPSGIGLIPLAIWRTIIFISSFCSLLPEVAVSFATGNTKKKYNLDEGEIGLGLPADLQVIDAPVGSQGKTAREAISYGDLPAISLVMIDGQVVAGSSSATQNSKRKIVFK